MGVIRVGRVEELSPEYERREDLDLSLNLSYVSIGTVWYGTVRVRRGRWNMSMISWQQKVFQCPKELATCTVVTNETMMNEQRQRQRQMKKRRKVAVTDGRLPLVAAMLHVVKLPTASAAQHYCPHGCVCCVHVCTGHVLYTVLLFARRSQGI